MPRIAIIGSGAIGQFYGAQLVLAGHDVRFLARRDAPALSSRGLVIHQTRASGVASTSTHSILRIGPDRFRVDTDPERLASPSLPDWVFIALKATAFSEVHGLIAPLVGPRTRIVALANGLGVEETLAQWFEPARVFGLLCFVGVNRDDDGTIRHLALGHVAAGHFLDQPNELSALRQLCQDAGIRCIELDSLLEARWRKLTWNIPFNGLCVLHDTTTDGVVGNPERRALALLLAHETVAVGNADLEAQGRRGRIEAAWAEKQVLNTDKMGAYAPSTLLDARAGRPLEHDVLFAEPLRRSERLGVDVPELRRLASALLPHKAGNGPIGAGVPKQR